MLKAISKWTLVVGCLLAVGPAASAMMTSLRDVDGGRAVTFMVNGNTGAAVTSAAALFAASLVVGVVASRFFSLVTAMLCSGFVMGWGAGHIGTLETIARRAGNVSDLPVLAIEGFLLTAIAVAFAGLFIVLSRKAQLAHGDGATPATSTPVWQRLLITGEPDTSDSLMPFLAGAFASAAVVCAVVVWVLGQTGAPMQTFMAAVIGGMAAGGIATSVVTGKGYTLTPLVPMLAMAVLALVAPFVAQGVQGAQLFTKVTDGTVLNLARPISLDWAAGAMIGVPLGMTWAGTVLDKRPH